MEHGAAQDRAWQVRVQQAAFDVSAELADMQGGDCGIGGIGMFVGTVRDLMPGAGAIRAQGPDGLAGAASDAAGEGGPAPDAAPTRADGHIASSPATAANTAASDAAASLHALELEHYPGMTERLLAGMLDEARQRFGLRAGRIVHRVGRLAAGEPIVLVMAAAEHRHAALDGCAFLMDWLKTDAPFWKKEHTAAGSRWVEARESDDRALARWGRRSGNAAAAGADPTDAAPAGGPAA